MLLSNPATAALSVPTLGAATLLLCALAGHEAGRISAADAKRLIQMHGIGEGQTEEILQALRATRIVEYTGQSIALPCLSVARTEVESSTQRRLQGWNQRREAAAKPAVAPLTSAPAAAVASDPLPLAARRVPAKPRTPKASPSPVRVSSSADDRSPEFAQIPLRGDITALVTRAFVDQLQALYTSGSGKRLVDAEQEIRKAARWCVDTPAGRKTSLGIRRFLTSWVNRAAEREQTRMAVIATSNERNGFGQGGSYVSAEPRNEQRQLELTEGRQDLLDDLAPERPAATQSTTSPSAPEPAQPTAMGGPKAQATAYRLRRPTREAFTIRQGAES